MKWNTANIYVHSVAYIILGNPGVTHYVTLHEWSVT